MTLYFEGKTPLDVDDLSLKQATSGFAGERHEARDGASDVSTKDRGDCFDTLEQRATSRRGTTEAASSLSVAQTQMVSQIACLGGDAFAPLTRRCHAKPLRHPATCQP